MDHNSHTKKMLNWPQLSSPCDSTYLKLGTLDIHEWTYMVYITQKVYQFVDNKHQSSFTALHEIHMFKTDILLVYC